MQAGASYATEEGPTGAGDNGIDDLAASRAGLGSETGDPETGAWDLAYDDADLGPGEQGWRRAQAWDEAAAWEEGGYRPGYPARPTWQGPEPEAWDSRGQGGGPGTWYDYDAGRYGPQLETPPAFRAGYEPGGRDPGAYQTVYGAPPPARTWDGGARGRPAPRRRRRRRGNGPWPELAMIAAVAVIIAAVVLAVSSANQANLANTQAGGPSAPSSLVPTASSSPSTTPRSSTPTSSRRPPTSAHHTPTTTEPVLARNLFATADLRAALVRSWIATNPGGAGLAAKDVAGIAPGQLYYAYQPGKGTYWALAVFQPSAKIQSEASTAAGQAALAQFQNKVYVFSWRTGAGPDWTLLGDVTAGSCPGFWVPSAVLGVWGLCGLKPSA